MNETKLIELKMHNYETLEDMWVDTIDDAFGELEDIIDELDLSSVTIFYLIDILRKDKRVLFENLMMDVKVIDGEVNKDETNE